MGKFEIHESASDKLREERKLRDSGEFHSAGNLFDQGARIDEATGLAVDSSTARIEDEHEITVLHDTELDGDSGLDANDAAAKWLRENDPDLKN